MIKFSASKVLLVALAALLALVITGCGKKDQTLVEAATEQINETEHISQTQQAADDGSITEDNAAVDADVSTQEKELDDYSAQELIDQIKSGETPMLYGGASPEALTGLFADSADGLEMDEEEAEELKDFAFEEYEALPYDPDAPWSDEGVVYELVEGADDVRPEAGKEADIGEDVSDDYSFLKLPAGTTPFADGTDWMVTFNGDADSCKEYISAVKKAGYTVDAEDTDMMGILMYEGSNSDGERASIMYTNGSISIIFEKQ